VFLYVSFVNVLNVPAFQRPDLGSFVELRDEPQLRNGRKSPVMRPSPKERVNTAPPQSMYVRLLAALVVLCCRAREKESIKSMAFSFILSVTFKESSKANPLVLQTIIVPLDWNCSNKVMVSFTKIFVVLFLPVQSLQSCGRINSHTPSDTTMRLTLFVMVLFPEISSRRKLSSSVRVLILEKRKCRSGLSA
jgi:hypothetical protein